MKAYIILEDGHIFCGERFGADGDVLGELVFTTSMGGYIETITDPAYYGQIVLQTFPHIGNYGMISEDKECEKPYLKGYVVRDLCDAPSNFRSEGCLEDYLKENNIVGIKGVDTRELTRIIRENGVMNAKIVSELPSDKPQELLEYKICDAVKTVSCEKEYTLSPDGEAKFKVAFLDLGTQRSLAERLLDYGCSVTVLPYNTPAEKLMEFDGVMLSSGPGDPKENKEVIENVKKIFGKKPIFGVSLGHQILALASGAETEKLKYGHRGANQPVKNSENGRVYISSQNHGYAVKADSLPDYAKVSFIHVNDGSCAGVEYEGKNAFSVQFNPEACSAFKKANFLYDKFISMLGGDC